MIQPDCSSRTVIAPGKVFLAGEWSVLSGGWCLVSTLDVHARARLVPEGEDFPGTRELVSAILQSARSPVVGGSAVSLDLGEFERDGIKLGVGSSAAATAAVLGLVEIVARGRIGRRDDLARRCASVHRDLQGGAGSGADAAASARGGVIRFRMPCTVRPSSLQGHFTMVAVGLGVRGMRTSRILGRHRDLVAARDRRVLSNVDVFGEAAGGIIDGLERGEWHTLRTGVNVAAAAYGELGDLLGAELVTPHDRMVMRYTRRTGGVSRPTGAGGGDLHLAYYEDPRSAARFSAWATERGLKVIPVEPDPSGVRTSRNP